MCSPNGGSSEWGVPFPAAVVVLVVLIPIAGFVTSLTAEVFTIYERVVSPDPALDLGESEGGQPAKAAAEADTKVPVLTDFEPEERESLQPEKAAAETAPLDPAGAIAP